MKTNNLSLREAQRLFLPVYLDQYRAKNEFKAKRNKKKMFSWYKKLSFIAGILFTK